MRKPFIRSALLFSQIFFLKFYSILHDLFAHTHWLILSHHIYDLRANLVQLTLWNMTTNGQCLRSNSQKDYGIQGVILSRDITSITATWGAKLQVNVDSWKIVKIAGKNRGIVATRNLPKELSLPCMVDMRSPVIHWTWKTVAKHLPLTDTNATCCLSLLERHLLMSQMYTVGQTPMLLGWFPTTIIRMRYLGYPF